MQKSYRFRVRLEVIAARWVCKKIAQNVAQAIFCQNTSISLTVEKSSPKMWPTFYI
jgi:hypothetical protein